MDQLKKEETYYNESYCNESIEMPTRGKKIKDFFDYSVFGLTVFAILLLTIFIIYYSIIGNADKNVSDWNNILNDRALTSEKITGVLLKDNHIGAAGGVKEAVKMAKEYAPFVRKIEVEVETLDMVRDAVEAGADIIMLDNMEHDTMAEAMKIIDGKAEVEVSGNMTKENLEKLAGLSVNYVSSGALTHSAPILDISLKNLHPVE